MRVLVGMPDKEAAGGPVACEPPFVEALGKLGADVVEEIYVHADRQAHTHLWSRAARVLRTARSLRRRLRAEPFDLVHLNTSFDTKALLRDAVTVSFLGSGRARIFLKFHGSDAALLTTRNPALRFLGQRLLARVDGMGVLSSEEKENFIRAGASREKVFVVKNAVREVLVQSERAEFFRRMRIKEDVPVLLFIARFIPAKGLIDVIRACGILRERGQEFALFCVGDGPERVSAEAETARLGLSESVRFTGYITEDEASEFYSHATMLVFPTYHYEGFPMVIFNALAAGIPVITTRIRAAADYLREPDNCLWVEPKNPAMLADKIIQLLSQTELREAMARNNLELVQKFAPERVAREYMKVYQAVIGDE